VSVSAVEAVCVSASVCVSVCVSASVSVVCIVPLFATPHPSLLIPIDLSFALSLLCVRVFEFKVPRGRAIWDQPVECCEHRFLTDIPGYIPVHVCICVCARVFVCIHVTKTSTRTKA